MSARLRAGIVGAGGVAARHAATLRELGDVEIVGVTDLDPARAAALGAEHDAPACPDVEALLGQRLDAAWVCLPPGAHGPAETALLEAGVPFLVEKPVAADLRTAERLAAEVERRGALTATGYHWRNAPGMRAAEKALADAPARLAVGLWLDKVPPVGWWPYRETSPGQLVEQVTHLVDTLRVLAGEPVTVHALAGQDADRDPALVDAASVATLRLDSGAVASLAATSELTWKAAAALTLVGSGVRVDVDEQRVRVQRGDDVVEVVDAGAAKREVDAEFCAAVRSGDRDRVRAPYPEALRTHRVGCALAASVERGEPVQVAVFRG